ncbi:MAG TPA: glucose 1-dehydrogenase [Stellaceae bacterium]|nr:glucose 1-dehydrogenase [Stellaceae bacterium]
MTQKYPAIFDLSGKVAVVTGAASGLGAEISEAMAEAGADVVCADLDVAGLRPTTARVEALGRRALAVHCDVTDEAQVDSLMQAAEAEFGRLDILFNNAGISDGTATLVHEYDTARWKRMIAVDLHGVFYCARAALKIMVRQRSGKIINIASIWGLAGAAHMAALPGYCAAKGAVVNLTRELALQYASYGIFVNAICPGFFVTRLADGIYDRPEFLEAVAKETPMGRPARADEIKGTAIYLASSASDYVTGTMLVADGGISAK